MAGSFDSVRAEMVCIIEQADKQARELPKYGIRRPKKIVEEKEEEKEKEKEPEP